MSIAIRSIAARLPGPQQAPEWYAFRVRHRREKQVYRRMQLQGIEAYLPLRREVRRYASKNKTVELPLFPNYILLRLKRENYGRVLADPDVVSIISFEGEPGIIRQEEIEFLRTILNDGGQLYDPQTGNLFSRGDEVVITGGTLAGIRGKIVEEAGKHRFLVAIPSLQLSVNIQISQQDLLRI